MVTIDYSALTEPVDKAALAAFRAESKREGRYANNGAVAIVTSVIAVAIAVFLGAMVVAIVGGFVVSSIASIVGGDLSGGAVLVIVVALGVLGLAGFVLWRVLRSVLGLDGRWARWFRLSRFAAANRMSYVSAIANPVHPGLVFQQGSERRSTDVLRTVAAPIIEIGNLHYTTGSGKNRRLHEWGYLAMRLERRLPHLVLDARANDASLFGLRSSNLPASFSRDQVLSLEGDFDRHFTLYCPREYERDALYVLTPDLMALLIDETGAFDVEIVDDQLFVYSATPFELLSPAALARLFRIVDTVGAKTLRQTDRYADARMPDRTANVVAAPGRRLRSGVSVAGVLIAAAIVASVLWNLIGSRF